MPESMKATLRARALMSLYFDTQMILVEVEQGQVNDSQRMLMELTQKIWDMASNARDEMLNADLV